MIAVVVEQVTQIMTNYRMLISFLVIMLIDNFEKDQLTFCYFVIL